MKNMIEETKEMADGCPEKAVIDISKQDLKAGKYDTFVEALNAALRHLEVTDIKAFISKQDLSGRWKFELVRAVSDCKDTMDGIVSDEDEDKPPMPTEEPGKYVPDENEIFMDGSEEDYAPDADGLGM